MKRCTPIGATIINAPESFKFGRGTAVRNSTSTESDDVDDLAVDGCSAVYLGLLGRDASAAYTRTVGATALDAQPPNRGARCSRAAVAALPVNSKAAAVAGGDASPRDEVVLSILATHQGRTASRANRGWNKSTRK